MIKASAHTMATPDLALPQALELFAELTFEGAEIICADDYPCGLPTQPTTAQVAHTRDAANGVGLTIANLVPYVRELNSRDAGLRVACVDAMKRCIDLAEALQSRSVRVWAGVDPDRGHEDEQTRLLIESLHTLSAHAADSGLILSVENHRGSQAISGAATADLVTAVASPHLGILYDPANLLVMGDVDYRAAFAVQAPHITHVHFKDVDVLGNSMHLPRITGEGEVPWEWIIPALAESGYTGFVSTEFEKRWHPESLPPSREGLQHELAQLRRWLSAPHQDA